MKILAIDTTSDMLCIGLRGGGRDMEYDLLAGKKHAAFCLLTVERILAGQGWQAREIDYFACGLGPGSFTGIRTGVATVKGMAWAVKKPVVGVPSLDLLARNALEARESFDEEPARLGGRVVAVTDARRGLLYACVYRREGNSLRRNITVYAAAAAGLIEKGQGREYNSGRRGPIASRGLERFGQDGADTR
jgi:Inactive homolog of metal-dependent proteases, putative molecular chaperone